MKKSVFLMAMAGVVMAGCVSNEVEEIAQKQEKMYIGFNKPVLYNNASRAGFYGEIGPGVEETSTQEYTYPKKEDFMVYANEHESSFSTWDNSQNFWGKGENMPILVKYHSSYGGWFPYDDTNSKYIYKTWPNNKNVTFVAYSPADLLPYTPNNEKETEAPTTSVSYNSNNGFIIEDFKVADDPQHQIDLLYSDISKNNTAESIIVGLDDYYNGIPIKFHHALSSIHFSVENDTDIATGEKVELFGIQILGAKCKGTFTESNSTKWENEDETKTYYPYIQCVDGIEFPRAAKHVSEIINETTGLSSTEKFSSLLLLPQDLDGIKIKVQYSVNDAEPIWSDEIDLKGQMGVIRGQSISSPVNVWEPGKRYTYLIRYGAAATAEKYIYFAPETYDWADIDNIIIDL